MVVHKSDVARDLELFCQKLDKLKILDENSQKCIGLKANVRNTATNSKNANDPWVQYEEKRIDAKNIKLKIKVDSLPWYHPSVEIKNAIRSDFADGTLRKIENLPLREYLKSKQLKSENLCNIFKVLLQIEDTFNMSQYTLLVQENVIIECVGRNLYQIEIKKGTQFKDVLSPHFDNAVMVPQASYDREPKPKHAIDILQPHRNESISDQSHLRYVGCIHSVSKKQVSFKWGDSGEVHWNDRIAPFVTTANDLKQKRLKKYTIIFRSDRIPMRYQRRALDELKNAPNLLTYLFPTVNPCKDLATIELRLINSEMADNPEQLQAVRNIVEGPNLYAPYVIFGPPGTGKTTTIIESILQLRRQPRPSRILVSAGSNAACDTIALRIIKYLNSNPGPLKQCALIRIFSKSVQIKPGLARIDKTLLKNSNFRGGAHWHPTIEVLQHFHVIVATLCTVGTYFGSGRRNLNFTHIFIDEASASTEPETLIAITGLRTKTCGVILSGDHKQLGPVLESKRAAALGLKQSLMERLLLRDCYALDSKGDYDRSLQTRLRRNYRSHPAILGLYNHLYYNNELIAAASNRVVNTFVDRVELPNPKFPIIFQAVHGTIWKCDSSSSSANHIEIAMVMQYVKSFLTVGQNGHPVSQADIGIVTPYKLQGELIQRQLWSRSWKNVEVGSAEKFQGREKPIIIMSLVRSFSGLGFVSEPRRLNVMISRAKSLLILIGNPSTLSKSADFRYIIEECKKQRTFIQRKGCKKLNRTATIGIKCLPRRIVVGNPGAVSK